MAEEKVFTVSTEPAVKLTARDIDDIMCTALEGGVSFWCDEAKVVGKYLGGFASDQISRGGKLLLFAEHTPHELTLDKFLDGMRKYISDGEPVTVDADGNIDTCDIDAIMADMIVQYAVFGEVIYS